MAKINLDTNNIVGIDGGEKGAICVNGEFPLDMPIAKEQISPKIFEVLKEKVKSKSVPIIIKSLPSYLFGSSQPLSNSL